MKKKKKKGLTPGRMPASVGYCCLEDPPTLLDVKVPAVKELYESLTSEIGAT
jgi:hypothetical protein